ncbi:MAG: transposase, partial [Proteobacteria bacterium]|nr:transposase [Pseudomonadota bacterium]
MARKPRIHYPGAFYHVMLRGNGGQNIFYSTADRSRFCLLMQEGVERYRHRIHAYCLMSNHVHLIIEVGTIPLSRIIQNLSFRYTRYINTKKKRIGHLFQGRYKSLLIDGDSYLLELVRYIHCNPVRAGLVKNPDVYRWSSHQAYLGKNTIPWLMTQFVLSQFAARPEKAQKLYHDFVQSGIFEARRQEFHTGIFEGRILGDETFSESALALAEEQRSSRYSLKQIIDTVCLVYGINPELLSEPGKKQPAAMARAIVAYLVQEEDHSLTDLGNLVRRDLSALSRAAGRIRERAAEDVEISNKLILI